MDKKKQRAQIHRSLQKSVRDTRAEYIADLMAKLQIGQEDIRESESLGYQIEEVLMQIEGDFFKFDTTLRQNVLVRAGIFLSIQKVKDKNAIGGLFLLNVHDMSNKVSFTCQELLADN